MRSTAGWRVTVVACVLLTTAAVPAFAQAHAGIRAGVSGSPDQFFFGGHIESRPRFLARSTGRACSARSSWGWATAPT